MDRGDLCKFRLRALERGNVAAEMLAAIGQIGVLFAAPKAVLDVPDRATSAAAAIWALRAIVRHDAAADLADEQIVSSGHQRQPH